MEKKEQLKIKTKWQNYSTFSRIKISKKLRDIIHGYIMSDGYVNTKGILQVEQSKKQEKFLLWLYCQLKSIASSSGIKEHIRIHTKTEKKSYNLSFFTKAVLKGFHNMWYKSYKDHLGIIRYKKKIPNTINCFFNEEFISIWFARYGTKTIDSLSSQFEVTTFSVEERLQLKSLFLYKFNIKTQIIKSGISKKGNIQWALKISSNEYYKFRNLITKSDIIPTLFPNKLHKKKM